MARWLAIFAVLAHTLAEDMIEDGIWDSCSAAADCPSESEFCAVTCFTGECSGRNKNCQPCDECHCDHDSADGTCLEVCGESAVNYEADCNGDDEDGFDPGIVVMFGFVFSMLSLVFYRVRKGWERKQEHEAAKSAMEYGLTSSAPDALILSGHSQTAYNGRYARANDLWNNRPHYVNEQGRQFYFYAVNEGGAPGWSLDARPQDDTKGAKDWCDGGWFPCDVDSPPVPPLGPSLRFNDAGSLSLQPVAPVSGGVGVVLDPAVGGGVVQLGAPVVAGVVVAPVVSGGGPIIRGNVVQVNSRGSKVRAVFNFEHTRYREFSSGWIVLLAFSERNRSSPRRSLRRHSSLSVCLALVGAPGGLPRATHRTD
jgi:hypothetical protein